MRTVVLDGYTTSPEDAAFGIYAGLENAQIYARTAAEDTAARIGDAQAVLTNKVVISREVMEACPGLRYIGVLATGYNVVDIEAAKERGITVTNVPAYSTQAVVQHAVAMLLHGMSRVAAYDARVKDGSWVRSEDFCFFDEPMEEVSGKTIGIVGYGNIGKAMARAALGLDMRVLVHTGHPPAEGVPGVSFVTMEELLGGSDVISLHCPLTEKTRGLIGDAGIAKMKDGVRVINTARGPVVDGRAMADALRSGKVACYMTDVMESEPPRADDPLLSAPHTVITPHVAWAPRQTRERLVGVAIANLKAWMEGRPQNVVC
ncbi:MAG: D-2-hydroxyacid dehydrogenase [Clostridia bacterium]|nr:D-2-hydroxyacid dehydrogenase [Clostridia bacterium]